MSIGALAVLLLLFALAACVDVRYATRAARVEPRAGEALVGPPVVRRDPDEIGGLWKARKLMLPLLRAQAGRYAALSVVNDVGVPAGRRRSTAIRLAPD